MLGITQVELASRLGSTPSAVAQLERSEENETIKLASLRSALVAMDLELRVAATESTTSARFAPARAAEEARAALRDGDEIGALRVITAAAAHVASASSDLDPDDLATPPSPLGSRRWDTLFRAIWAYHLVDAAPAWATEALPLSRRWYPAAVIPMLRARADLTTPPQLAALNIRIDERSLQRS